MASATPGWNKYNRWKAQGGIGKKGEEKRLREFAELIKADEKHNFETVMKQIEEISSEMEKFKEIQDVMTKDIADIRNRLIEVKNTVDKLVK